MLPSTTSQLSSVVKMAPVTCWEPTTPPSPFAAGFPASPAPPPPPPPRHTASAAAPSRPPARLLPL
ncbi:MAG: hypothetical protein L0206_04950, partial [Actinobacteria bacterium]|nr:hypothetical protein [Actinomycetota bacterium]